MGLPTCGSLYLFVSTAGGWPSEVLIYEYSRVPLGVTLSLAWPVQSQVPLSPEQGHGSHLMGGP